jgi:hypothetical protein
LSQFSTNWVQEDLFPEIQWPGFESGHSPAVTVESVAEKSIYFKNAVSCKHYVPLLNPTLLIRPTDINTEINVEGNGSSKQLSAGNGDTWKSFSLDKIYRSLPVVLCVISNHRRWKHETTVNGISVFTFTENVLVRISKMVLITAKYSR